MSSPSCRGLPLLLGAAVTLLCAACGDGATSPDEEVASIAVISVPELALPGVPLTTLPIVELRDRAGRAVAAAGIVVTASVSSGTLSGTTRVTTDAQGRAKFTDLVVDGTDRSTELRFACCGLPAVRRVLTLAVGEPSIARLDPEVVTGIAGETLSPGPRVLVRDERQKPKAGAAVRFEFDSGAALPAISVATDQNGVATLPSFQFADLPEQTLLTATDVVSGKSVQYRLAGTAHGNAYTLDETFVAVTVGGTATLPKLLVTDGPPVAGALVRYRVIAGNGVLSRTEAHTGADGQTEPVTLSTNARGTTQVEAIAVGYSRTAVASVVAAVSPPVRFEYAGPCDWGCPATLGFNWPLEGSAISGMDVEFEIRVRDAVGIVPLYRLTLTAPPQAGSFFGYLGSGDDFFGPWPFEIPSEGSPQAKNDGIATFVWRIPATAGSYSFTLGGPMIDTPWTYTATVQ